METKNFSYFLKSANKFLFLYVVSILFLSSCTSLKNIVDLRPSSPDTNDGSRSYEDQYDDKGKKVDTESVLGRKQDKPFRPKLALILGPGLVRSFAHVGLVKRLIESDIPIEAVVGMGWGSFAAFEFSSEGAVHGLEWKLSRSKELAALTKTSLWSSEVKPKAKSQTKLLVESLMPNKNSKGPDFGCSLMSGAFKKVKMGTKQNIVDCVSVPPLMDSGNGTAPYLMDVSLMAKYLKTRVAEKVIFINVLGGSSVSWGPYKDKMRASEKWYWYFVENSLNQRFSSVDHVFALPTSNFSMLDFNKTLDIIRTGYKESEKLVEFLQTEYQF